MPFGVLNINYSSDEAGKTEREQLSLLAFAPTLSKERTLYLKINCVNLPLEDYSRQTLQQYIQNCGELIRYCDELLNKAHFTARSLAILRLKVRVENIKQKCESGEKDILKCYEVEETMSERRYTNLALFRKTEASLEPTVLKLARERLLLCLSSPLCVIESPAVSWVMQNSDPKDPECYNIAFSLCSNPSYMSAVFQSLPESFNSLLESLLQSPTILERLHRNYNLLQFLTILSQRNPKLGECLLQNIDVIDFLVKSDTMFLEFLGTLTTKTVFRQALQKGFKYKDLLNFVQMNFSLYHNEASLILYEAMSNGDWSTVASLKTFFKLHINDQIKIKESSQAHTQFFDGSETKSVVKTRQEVSRYREEVTFELAQLTDYLVEKFEQNKSSKDASTQSKASLYFIDHFDDFVGFLAKNGFIAGNAVEEFKIHLSQRVGLKSSAPVNSDLVTQLVAQNKELLEKLTVSLTEIATLTNRVTELERSQEKIQDEIERLQTAAASNRAPGFK